MFKRLQWAFCVAAVWMAARPAVAADYQGTVTNVSPLNGKVYVYVENGAYNGSAGACGTPAAMGYWIDPNTTFGRALLAVALSAKLTGRQVYASGDTVCVANPWGGINVEGLNGLDLKG